MEPVYFKAETLSGYFFRANTRELLNTLSPSFFFCRPLFSEAESSLYKKRGMVKQMRDGEAGEKENVDGSDWGPAKGGNAGR